MSASNTNTSAPASGRTEQDSTTNDAASHGSRAASREQSAPAVPSTPQETRSDAVNNAGSAPAGARSSLGTQPGEGRERNEPPTQQWEGQLPTATRYGRPIVPAPPPQSQPAYHANSPQQHPSPNTPQYTGGPQVYFTPGQPLLMRQCPRCHLVAGQPFESHPPYAPYAPPAPYALPVQQNPWSAPPHLVPGSANSTPAKQQPVPILPKQPPPQPAQLRPHPQPLYQPPTNAPSGPLTPTSAQRPQDTRHHSWAPGDPNHPNAHMYVDAHNRRPFENAHPVPPPASAAQALTAPMSPTQPTILQRPIHPTPTPQNPVPKNPTAPTPTPHNPDLYPRRLPTHYAAQKIAEYREAQARTSTQPHRVTPPLMNDLALQRDLHNLEHPEEYLVKCPDGTLRVRKRRAPVRPYKRRLTRDERRDILLMRRLEYTFEQIALFLGTTLSAVSYTVRQNTPDVKHANAGRRYKWPQELTDKLIPFVEQYLATERAAGVDPKTGKKKIPPLTYKAIREAIFQDENGEPLPQYKKFTDDAIKAKLNKHNLYLRPPMSQAKVEEARARGKRLWKEKVEKDRLEAEKAARAGGAAAGDAQSSSTAAPQSGPSATNGYAEVIEVDSDEEMDDVFSGTESIPSDEDDGDDAADDDVQMGHHLTQAMGQHVPVQMHR